MARLVRDLVLADAPMVIWRLGSARYPLFSSDGARLNGGRWNHRGSAVIYASGSLAGAMLEILTRTSRTRPPDPFSSLRIQIPLDLEFDEPSLDHDTWDSPLTNEWTRDLGTEWLNRNSTPLFRVPSVVTRQEHNWLINPNHPHFPEVLADIDQAFRWDPRLFG